MKKRMNCSFIFTVILLCMLLSACGLADAEDEKVAKQFLTAVYTSNKDNRYNAFAEAVIENDEQINSVTETYYKEFEALLSEECLENMKANRIPFSYDRMAAEQNKQVTVDEISLTEEGEGEYSFAVVLKITGEKEETEERVGNLRMTQSEGKALIDFFKERN